MSRLRKKRPLLAFILAVGLLIPTLPSDPVIAATNGFDFGDLQPGISEPGTLQPVNNTPGEIKEANDWYKNNITDPEISQLTVLNGGLQQKCAANDSEAACKVKIDSMLKDLNIATSIKDVKGISRSLNYSLFAQTGWLVYGQPSDIANAFGVTNDFKTKAGGRFTKNGVAGEYRFVGFTYNGFEYTNAEFPPDATSGLKMDQKKWLEYSWNHAAEIHNYAWKPTATKWMNPGAQWLPYIGAPVRNDKGTLMLKPDGTPVLREYTRLEKEGLIAEWLGTIIDHHEFKIPDDWGWSSLRTLSTGILDVNTTKNPTSGGFGRKNAKLGNKILVNNYDGSEMAKYAVINVPPTPYSPGVATLFHRRYDNDWPNSAPDYSNGNRMANYHDWYESFVIPPTEPDLWKILDDSQVFAASPGGGTSGQPGDLYTVYASFAAVSPGLEELPKYDTASKAGLMNYTFSTIAGNGKLPVYIYVQEKDTGKIVSSILERELTINAASSTRLSITNLRYPATPGTSKTYEVIVRPSSASINEYNWNNNVSEFTVTSTNGEACECEFEATTSASLAYSKSKTSYSYGIDIGGSVNPSINAADITAWEISMTNKTTAKALFNQRYAEARGWSGISLKGTLNLPASEFYFDSSGNASITVSLRTTAHLRNGTSVTQTVPCTIEFSVFGGPATPIVPGPNPPPGNTAIVGGGLDNLRVTKLIPLPSNGAKKPGEAVDYAVVMRADTPSSYARISFNGGAQSDPIPLYSDVVSRLNAVNALPNASASNSGAITAPATITESRYVSRTCGVGWDTTRTPRVWNSGYECGGYENFTVTNPDYATAQSAASAIAALYPNVQATAFVQGRTCTVTLYRGGDEEYCTITGIMPDPRNANNASDTDKTNVEVIATAVGNGIRESNTTDNSARYMMYPILPTQTVASTSSIELYNIDPKDPSKWTLNSATNPIKFGQRMGIKATSTAGVRPTTTLYGYQLAQLYSELSSTTYTDNIPQASTFNVTGNTPSATYNGVSPYAGNKTWKDSTSAAASNNDFDNTSPVKDDGTKQGKKHQYLHKVTRTAQTYTIPGRTFNWDHYQTYYANLNSTNARVSVEWKTKADNAWIVDLVKTKNSPIGFWPEHSTIPPLKDGVPTPISKGGSYQSIPIEIRYGSGNTAGRITNNLYMFGTLSSSISTGN